MDNSISYTEDDELIEPLNKTASLGSVYSVDLDGDKVDEIIVSDYGFNPQFQKLEDRTTFKILKYKDKKYRYTKEFPTTGIFKLSTIGSTSIKTSDIDKDGDMDILIAYEGEKSGIEIWKNNSNLNFEYHQTISFSPSEMAFREFEISDINNDGYDDLLLHPYHDGTLYMYNNGINLEKCIWINNKGVYNSYDKPLLVQNIRPGFLKGFFIGGKIKFIGTEYSGNKFKLYEIYIKI